MDKQLKIAIVTETYFPQVNGVSRTLDRLVEHLLEQGHSVHLLIPDYGAETPTDRDGVTVTTFKARRLPNYDEILLPLVRSATMSRHLREIAPDIIHIATEGPLGWAALRAAGRLNLPVVSSYHTNFAQYMQAYRLKLIEGLVWKYLRWFHNRTRRTFCPTASIKELLLDKGFERLAVWGRGVDSVRFHPQKASRQIREQLGIDADEVVFLYCGRLAAEKNLGMLVEAFEKLENLKARLLIVGDGPMLNRLQNDCDHRVVFAGYRYGEELARFYASADVMAFPSLSETFGNVMLEAMASGLPVIGFDVPGPKDIVQHGRTGELVHAITAQALYETMKRFFKDAEYRRTLGQNARLYAEQQNWALINTVVSNGYRECLGPASPTAAPAKAKPGASPVILATPDSGSKSKM